MTKGSVFLDVYKIVQQIPRGKVFTYGAISLLLNKRLTAQGVGWALNALVDSADAKDSDAVYHSANVPWHRVINSRGGVSTSKRPDMPQDLQRILLEAEGVKFNSDGFIELQHYLWAGLSKFPSSPRKTGAASGAD